MVSKTLQYILPTFIHNKNRILTLVKPKIKRLVGMGVWDFKDDTEYKENSVYFLLHFNTFEKKEFKQFITEVRQDKSYIKDYLYGDYLHDFLHMIVLECPEKEAFQHFLSSQYSKMFDEDKSKVIYKPLETAVPEVNQTRIKARKVITKSKQLRRELANKFNMPSIPIEYELDSKLNPNHEIFNYSKGKHPIELKPLIEYYEQ